MIKMEFGNKYNPSMEIYRHMLDRLYDQYLYHSGKKDYQVLQKITQQQTGPNEETQSIDDILAQDSSAVLDKVKNTALSIAYRIKIHDEINDQLDYNWFIVKNEMLHTETMYRGRLRGFERRKSALTTELLKVYKDKLDEKLECWKDLKDEMKYFIHLFHQYKALKGDRKLLY